MPAWAAAMGPAWATMEDIKAEWEWGVGLETWLPGADDNVALLGWWPISGPPHPISLHPYWALMFMPQALFGVSGAWGSRDGPDLVPVPLGLSTGEDRCPFGLLTAEGWWWGRCVGDICERGWSAGVGWATGVCEGKDLDGLSEERPFERSLKGWAGVLQTRG